MGGITCFVTGATGFVGRALCEELLARRYLVRAGVRRIDDAARLPRHCEVERIESVDGDTQWRSVLRGVTTVVHLAARVHVMQDRAPDPLAAFRKVNVEGTVNLAKQAVAAGVRRFIFISSIKVNGESTLLDHPFTADDPLCPRDPYGISKHEAEKGLRQWAAKNHAEVVIIRPPLVYGPRVKGNFLRLLQWVDRGVPLPFANVNNRRSLVNVRNLVDLIVRCIEHPAAAGETFLVSDGEDVSTADLVKHLAAAMGRRPRLFPVPLSASHVALNVMGKDDLWQRLFGSLQVNCEKTKKLLGWTAPVALSAGLEEVAGWYLRSKSSG